MWTCNNMQKIRLFYWFVLEIWLIKKSCNLIGWEHFGTYLRNKDPPKYGICTGAQEIIKVFIIEQIQRKLTTKSFNKFKKPCFWSIFGPFSQTLGQKIFPENPALSYTTSYGFLAPYQNSEKTNDTIPRKRLDRKTNGTAEGRTDLILPWFFVNVNQNANF